MYVCMYVCMYLYMYIRGSLNKPPDFFRMGNFIDTHMEREEAIGREREG